MSGTRQEQLQTFLRLLTTAAANASLYHANHRQVLRLNNQALQIAHDLIKKHNEIVLKVIDSRLIFDNQPVEQSNAVKRLVSAMNRCGVSHLQIKDGIYADELLGLALLLSKSPSTAHQPTNTEHICYGKIEVRLKGEKSGAAASPLAWIAESEADSIMDLYQTIRKNKPLNIGGVAEIVSGFISAFDSQNDVLMAIAPLRSMDEYTYTHSTNICMLNLAQARMLGIEGQLLNDIGIAAMLHDVGKMFIPPEILTKSEALTVAEWEIMQQHPRLGAEYLTGCPGVPRLAVITAYEHHMRFDNAGYPQTSRPWLQHLSSYLTAISDTYDAMRTHRAYEESLDLNQIISIMLNLAGNKLHPQLTYNFLGTISELDRDLTKKST